jgi:hypothetical protein
MASSTVLLLLQGAAAISQVILVIGLYIAWRQLSVALKDIRIRNERDAKSLAITEAGTFVKLIDQFTAISEGVPSEVFRHKLKWKAERDFRFSDSKLVDEKVFIEKLEKTREYLMSTNSMNSEISQYTNELERFAMSFTKCLADETAVFDSLAEPFCAIVEQFYFFYVLMRRSGSRKAYQNTIDLYRLWKQRQNASQLEYQKTLAQKNIVELDSQLTEIREGGPTELVPIGTDVQ